MIRTLIQVCDAIRYDIEEAIPDFAADSAGKKIGATVIRDWDPIPWTAEKGLLYGSRVAYVVPVDHEFLERASRAIDRNAFPLIVAIFDSYRGELDAPGMTEAKKQYIDDYMGWAGDLYEVLTANDYEPIPGAYLVDEDILQLCDRDMMRAHKVISTQFFMSYALHEAN